MPFKYKKVLLVGATSGIGWALAERILSAESTKVIIVGRRAERLNELAEKYGKENAIPNVFDITQLSDIPSWAAAVTKDHPDLDCVFLNSGIQKAHNFAKPESVNLDWINEEITTNYLAYVHMTTAFLPHLQKQRETSLIYVSSGLALIPSPRVLNYSASKAALHHFILALREQLKSGPGKVNVIEVMPPAVQTELHDTKHQPDLPEGSGARMGMPLKDFTNEAWEGLENGEEQVVVGDGAKNAYKGWEGERQKIFQKIFTARG
jgi:short-subunit dehydrogenase involved in D-alanine esterification of teichoic acids